MIDIFEIYDTMKKEEDEAKAKKLETDSKENKARVEDVLKEEPEKGLEEEPEKGLKEESED